jgi:hypothetical protein
MNAQELRQWLMAATGKQMETDNFLFQFMVGGVPGNGTPANSSTGQYFPCLVRRVVKPNGFGYMLKITGCLQGGADALFVKDHPNQSLHANASQFPIVISGRFSGCTFARCVGANGHLYIAHIFVDGGLAGNNPAAQARAFETAVGAAANSAVGFTTAGRVMAPAMRGYVFGTFDGANWQWNWLTADTNGNVVSCQALGPADWVAL